MICPHCKENITTVYCNIITETTQVGHLEGNVMTSFSQIDYDFKDDLFEGIKSKTNIFCTNCINNITEFVVED